MSIDSDHDRISPSPSFSRRISRSPLCCFVSHTADDHPAFYDSDSNSTSSDSSKSPSSSQSTSSSTGWLKSGGDHDLPIKKKCASFISKLRRGGKRRAANITAEFKYDPLSYALNFEDEAARFDIEPLRNFSDRLPATPERRSMCVVSREISAWS